MEKKFVQIQLALFFKNDFKGAVEEISLEIKKQFGSDVNTQILGIPESMPAEIPRLIVKSSVVNVNLSKNRIDFFSEDKNFFSTNKAKVASIIEKLSVGIGRIGVVATFFKETSINDIKSLLNSAKILDIEPNEVTLRLNNVTEINGIKTNNAQIYVNGSITEKNGTKKDGIVITRDINTMAEELTSSNFVVEKIFDFLNLSIVKAEDSLI